MQSLSVLIATVPEREVMFDKLLLEFISQGIRPIFDSRPRGRVSIGQKRQDLLNLAMTDYIVYFDDDDWPKPDYIESITGAIQSGPDCVGFKIAMTTNGANPQTCIHSLRNDVWQFKDGIYLRNVTHFNPVKRSLALQVGFEDLRFGEDKIYSDKISKLCHTEVFIDKYLFDYRYTTHEPSNKKYGIS